MALKKIKSEAEKEARKKRMQIIVSVIMMSLLLLSTFGYFASELFGNNTETDSNKIEYGGLVFEINNGFYTLNMNGQNFYFYDLPNASRGILSEEVGLEQYLDKPLYLVEGVSEAQPLILNLNGFYSRVQEACYKEDCGNNLPIKTCTDNLIIFRESEETKIEKEENCVFIYGDFTKGVDAISYNFLGIK